MRLTKYHRDALWNRLCSRAFDKREATLKQAKLDFASLLYSDLYSTLDLRVMAKAPAGHYGTRGNVRVAFAGLVVDLPLPEPRTFTFDHAYNSYKVLKAYEPGSQMGVIWHDIDETASKLKAEKSRALSQFNAVFDSVTTDKALLEAWPEIAEVVGTLFKTQGTRAVVVPGELNKALGLGGGK